jgi:hypothetical protein
MRLTANASERMRIDSNGRVSIGGTTVTDVNMLNIQGSGASSNIGVVLNDTNTSKVYSIQNGGSSLKFHDYSASATRMVIDSSGNVGIGVVPETWNGLKALQINSQASVSADGSSLQLGTNCYYNSEWKYINAAAATNYFQNGGTHVWRYAASGSADAAITWSEAMRITSSGNVGIGTTSITTGTLGSSNRFLEVSAGTANGSGTLVLSRNTSANNQEIGGVRFVNQNNSTDGSNNNSGKLVAAISGRSVTTDSNAGDDSGGVLVFNTKPETGTLAERMRIDSSGNLLVGGTNSTPHNLTSGGGFSVRGSLNLLSVARQDNEAMILNRTGTDGEIVDFRKDGTTVGNIGTESNGDFVINGAGNHAGIRFVSDSLTPRYAGNDFDNGIDLGKSDARFDDIFATNGTIQTSDQQEKNTITDSDLGLDFINRLEPKSYVFNGKTRTHYGLIAQDVETVLGDISKPTSGFAGFIKSDISEEQDGSEYRYGLRYTEFVGPLIQAVKDLKAENDAMRARLTALENAE